MGDPDTSFFDDHLTTIRRKGAEMGGNPWKPERRKKPCSYWLFQELRGFFVFSLFVLVLLRM